MAILLFSLVMGACSILRPPEPVREQYTTESGLVYTILREGYGPKPAEGDLLEVHYTGRLSDGSVFDSSYEREEPVQFRLGSGQVIKGWEEGMRLMREGGKAIFVIPPALAYGDMAFGPVPQNETLSFEVELLRVHRPAESIEAEGIMTSTTPSGVKYILLEEGEGIPLDDGMHVELHYMAFLDDPDQQMFDNSYDRGEPLRFILGRGMVIAGWDEALAELRVGDKARMWVPHQLAYGERGRGPVPPETDVMFEVDILYAGEPGVPQPFPTQGRDTLHTESGMQLIIVEEGTGDPPGPGSILTVHYSAYLEDGSLFDSSVQRSEPIHFVLGSGQVLQGLDEAFTYLREGSKARLIIPPHLAYGEPGTDTVPANESLVFDVELIQIRK